MARITVGEENGTPVELYYEDHGSGRPVVLIHGWPLSGSGRRTAEAVENSKLVLVKDAPHGLNATHAQTFNAEVLAFLRG